MGLSAVDSIRAPPVERGAPVKAILSTGAIILAFAATGTTASAASTTPVANAAAAIAATTAATDATRARSSAGYSAASLYDQANAYARAGLPGLAVLHYERARLLAPGDRDMQSNLDAVREAQHLRVAPHPWYERIAFLQSPLTAALTGMLGLLLLGASAAAWRLLLPSRPARAAAAAGVALMAITLCQRVLLWPNLHAGDVIAHEAPVLEAPVPMGEA